MLLMVEKGIRRGICNSVYGYGKSNNKFMKKKMIKMKNHHIFNDGMSIIYMVGQCRKTFQ